MNRTEEARERIDPIYYFLLHRPDRIRENLVRLHRAGVIESIPTLWQIFMGVLYMAHRIVFRPDSIGTNPDAPVRETLAARFLEMRPVRSSPEPSLRMISPVSGRAPRTRSGICSAPITRAITLSMTFRS
jgi:hypothetical protein